MTVEKESNSIPLFEEGHRVLNIDIDLDDDEPPSNDNNRNDEEESSMENNNKRVKNKLSRKVKEGSNPGLVNDMVKQEAIEEVKKEIAIMNPQLGKMIEELYSEENSKFYSNLCMTRNLILSFL